MSEQRYTHEERLAGCRAAFDRLGKALMRADEFWTLGDWESVADRALIDLRHALNGDPTRVSRTPGDQR